MALVAVVDVETTGIHPRSDRVVEFAAVVVDHSGIPVREFSTLINPDRDAGPVHIHGLSASDLAGAPTFSDALGSIVEALSGSCAVAGHNVQFDMMFLAAEFSRAGHSLPDVPRFCTMRMAGGGALSQCCDRFGISFAGPKHSALGDARATSDLLRTLMREASSLPAQVASLPPVTWPSAMPAARSLLTREQVVSDRAAPPTYLQRLLERAERFPSAYNIAEGVLEYDDVLTRAIIDRHVDDREELALLEVAELWKLGRDQIVEIHRYRMRCLIRAALQDGVISASEQRDLSLAGRLLGFDEEVLAALQLEEQRNMVAAKRTGDRTERVQTEFAGRTVCFTGESQCTIDGELIARERARALAGACGVTVIDSVTKKLDFLIVSDPLSQSGKAKKARERGIPLVHELVFWKAIGVSLD